MNKLIIKDPLIIWNQMLDLILWSGQIHASVIAIPSLNMRKAAFRMIKDYMQKQQWSMLVLNGIARSDLKLDVINKYQFVLIDSSADELYKSWIPRIKGKVVLLEYITNHNEQLNWNHVSDVANDTCQLLISILDHNHQYRFYTEEGLLLEIRDN